MVSNAAISVDCISKIYRIGSRARRPDTLCGALKTAALSPLKNLNYLRSLSRSRSGPKQDEVWALREVSFAVAAGEVVAIVGRNGSGKSTLLKVLSRITEPSGGQAEIRGRVSSLLEVGTGFHPELTGRENIYMNGTILGMTKREIDSKFDQIVDFSGVERFLETPCKRYSSGMQVRLAFAVAAHLDPDILIIDEVLAVGDAEFQKRCIGKMQEVATSGRTVLFVSHNMSAVGQLCTSGILLAKGQVAVAGSLDQVLRSYMQNLFETQAEVGNDNVRLCVQTEIDGSSDQRTWNYGSRLKVKVDVWTKQSMQSPAVDLVFHSSAGRMIFAQSDRLQSAYETQVGKAWRFEFEFVNNGFVSDYMTLDAGLRFRSSTRYLGMWHALAAVALGAAPDGFCHGPDCPVAVPCHMQIDAIDAPGGEAL